MRGSSHETSFSNCVALVSARVWTRACKGQGGISSSRRRCFLCARVSRSHESRATEPSTSWRPHHAPIPVVRRCLACSCRCPVYSTIQVHVMKLLISYKAVLRLVSLRARAGRTRRAPRPEAEHALQMLSFGILSSRCTCALLGHEGASTVPSLAVHVLAFCAWFACPWVLQYWRLTGLNRESDQSSLFFASFLLF